MPPTDFQDHLGCPLLQVRQRPLIHGSRFCISLHSWTRLWAILIHNRGILTLAHGSIARRTLPHETFYAQLNITCSEAVPTTASNHARTLLCQCSVPSYHSVPLPCGCQAHVAQCSERATLSSLSVDTMQAVGQRLALSRYASAVKSATTDAANAMPAFHRI